MKCHKFIQIGFSGYVYNITKSLIEEGIEIDHKVWEEYKDFYFFAEQAKQNKSLGDVDSGPVKKDVFFAFSLDEIKSYYYKFLELGKSETLPVKVENKPQEEKQIHDLTEESVEA